MSKALLLITAALYFLAAFDVPAPAAKVLLIAFCVGNVALAYLTA